MNRFFAALGFMLLPLYYTSLHAQTKKPNIIIILADDMGFSDLGCYGSEIQTPNLDQLASEGIRLRQFYNAARCCPSRAALMTGLYPHQAGMGWMAAADLGTPAYQDNLNNTSVTIAEVLRSAGYDTYMAGKWHLTHERKIDGNVTDNWPKQRGFNRYFGIVPGGANYFTPELYSDNHRYKAPDNFYLTDAISDTSVKFIDTHFKAHADQPLFMYVAYTAPHWPLHALQKEIDTYKERYKAGWDQIRAQRFERQQALGLFPKGTALSPRDSVVADWNSLPKEKQEEMAMRMAIYAAQIDIMDQGIGRIVAKLKEEQQLDNTLIFFMSDNGACAEFVSSGASKAVNGKKDTFESYRIQWANVSSTPFKAYKHYTYEGGIASPLIVHWPKGIDPALNNAWANGYGHLIDIMATCVDVAQATYPTTYKGHRITPMQGKSLAPLFTAQPFNRGKVFWEHEANIALRDGPWKLVTSTPENAPFDSTTLKLYDLSKDPTELVDLSKTYPERVHSMYQQWHQWGENVGVFPLDTRGYGARAQYAKRNLIIGFDDLLGGWHIKQDPTVLGTVSIDTTGKLQGKHALYVHMEKPGAQANKLLVNWPFQAKKGQRFRVSFQAKSNQNVQYTLRLEKSVGKGKQILEQHITTGTQTGEHQFTTMVVPENGPYRLSFYLGSLHAGDLWIDDVALHEL